MRLTCKDKKAITMLEAEIGRIFDQAERLDTEFGFFPIPACCFVGRPGYARIVDLRKTLHQIRKGKATLAGKEGIGK